MADKEFEEFRQFFEKLPQHIKAPSNCYTEVQEDVIVPQTVEGVRQEKSSGPLLANGPSPWSSTLLSRFEPDDIFSAGKICFYYNYLPKTCRAQRSSAKCDKEKLKGKGSDADATIGEGNTASRDGNRLAIDGKAIVRQRRKSNPEISQETKRIYGRDARALDGEDSLVQRMKLKLEEKINNQYRTNYHKKDEDHLKKRVEAKAEESQRAETTKLDKNPKKTVTVIFMTNITGTEKQPLLVIGRSNLKKTLKAAKTVPTSYKSSEEASLTLEIFESWLKQRDGQFRQSKRKIALLIDDSIQQLPSAEFKAMELITLPGHVTQTAHRTEGELSQELKTQYKLGLLDTWFRSSKDIREFQVSILDAMYMLRRAWTSIQPVTISHSFKACGLVVEGTPQEIPQEPDKISTNDFVAQCGITPKAFQDWISAEDEINARRNSTQEDILSNVEKDIIIDSSLQTTTRPAVAADGKSQAAPMKISSDLNPKSVARDNKQPDAIRSAKHPDKGPDKKEETRSNSSDISEDDEAASAFLPPNGRQMRAACSALQSFISACPEADQMLSHLAVIENFCVRHDIKSKIKRTASTHEDGKST